MPDSTVKELPADPTGGPAPSASMKQETGPEVYFRKGFGLKSEVQAELASDYSGRFVDMLREREFCLEAGGTTVRLAREFGFCYGVERAVDYAYQTRRKFPDRKVFLAGEIIHNPHVNTKLRDMGVEILEIELRLVVASLPTPGPRHHGRGAAHRKRHPRHCWRRDERPIVFGFEEWQFRAIGEGGVDNGGGRHRGVA